MKQDIEINSIHICRQLTGVNGAANVSYIGEYGWKLRRFCTRHQVVFHDVSVMFSDMYMVGRKYTHNATSKYFY